MVCYERRYRRITRGFEYCLLWEGIGVLLRRKVLSTTREGIRVLREVLSIVYYGKVFTTMGRYCLLWKGIVYYGKVLSTMERYCLLWEGIVYYGKVLSTTVGVLDHQRDRCFLCHDFNESLTFLKARGEDETKIN